ncbi:MAG TPA: NHL repeat-containing protein [Candidatus Angelobacter sp.]|jgi:sugar lactone lactonase YvrE
MQVSIQVAVVDYRPQGLKIGMKLAKAWFRPRSIFVIFLSLFLTVSASSQTSSGPVIFTVAGGGLTNGVPATSTGIGSAGGIAADRNGNFYIADDANYVIRKIDANGIMTIVAGNGTTGGMITPFGDVLGTPGGVGDGGPATRAEFFFPGEVAVDSIGNIFINDFGVIIRKVDTNGIITTIAGNGTQGFSGDGGPATSAQINASGMAVDGTGSLYITDGFGGTRVRKISSNGIITTVAGNGTLGFAGDGASAIAAEINARDVSADINGNFYIADGGTRIRKVNTSGLITTVAGTGVSGFSGDGGPATGAQISADRIAVDAAGNFYIHGGARIRKVDTNGIISTVAGNGTVGFTGDGGPATNAQISGGIVAADALGNVYITQNLVFEGSRIRKVNIQGLITTVAGNATFGFNGDSKPAITAEIDAPSGVAVDGAGNLYIGDYDNYRIRKVDTAGGISTIAGNGTLGLCGSCGDGGPATGAQLNSPYGIVLDSSGNLYFADAFSGRVREVDTSGVIHTIAGGGNVGLGDGGPATSASLNEPLGIALDGTGNLYISDFGDFRIRKVNAAGIITTVAGNGTSGFSGDGGAATSAQLTSPTGLVTDSAGNVYLGDGSRVRKIDTSGIISTIAGNGIPGFTGDGGPAINAELGSVDGLALDKSGSLYINDGNNRIRKVDTHGIISTFAGTGNLNFSGDGGLATNAEFARPGALAIDKNDNVYVGDVFNYRVREIVVVVFTLAATSSITIPSPGASGSTGLTFTPAAHFSGTVNLTCSVAFTGTGSPNLPPTCSVTPNPVNLAAPSNTSATLTITTTAPQTALVIVKANSKTLAGLSATLLLGLLGIVTIPCRYRRNGVGFSLSLLTAVLVFSAIGCGGGNGTTPKQTTPGTTSGTYNVTVTAKSGAFSNSVVVPVTVQ